MRRPTAQPSHAGGAAAIRTSPSGRSPKPLCSAPGSGVTRAVNASRVPIERAVAGRSTVVVTGTGAAGLPSTATTWASTRNDGACAGSPHAGVRIGRGAETTSTMTSAARCEAAATASGDSARCCRPTAADAATRPAAASSTTTAAAADVERAARVDPTRTTASIAAPSPQIAHATTAADTPASDAATVHQAVAHAAAAGASSLRSRTQGATLSASPEKTASPIPATSSSWSMLVNGPLASRQSMMRWASAGPMRGNVSSAATSAVFRCTVPSAVGPVEPPGTADGGRRSLAHGEHHELLAVDHLTCEVHPRRIRLGGESAGRGHRVDHAGARPQLDEAGPHHRAEHVHQHRRRHDAR